MKEDELIIDDFYDDIMKLKEQAEKEGDENGTGN